MEIGVLRRAAGKHFVEADHRLTQQNGLVLLGSAMRMQLDEIPIGPGGNLDARFEPQIKAML